MGAGSEEVGPEEVGPEEAGLEEAGKEGAGKEGAGTAEAGSEEAGSAKKAREPHTAAKALEVYKGERTPFPDSRRKKPGRLQSIDTLDPYTCYSVPL